MSLRVPASLRLTVPLIVLGFAAVLSTVNVLYHVPRAERAVEEDVSKRVAQEMSRLQSTLEYLLLKGDVEVAQREISVLAHNHDYIFAVLTDDRDEVIAATRRAWLERPIGDVVAKFDPQEAAAALRERRARLSVSDSDQALHGYAGILIGSEREEVRPSRAGMLFLAHDLQRPKSEARAQVLEQSLYWAGWVTALALVMWLGFHFLLTRRTAHLVRAAEQLAAGNLEARSGLRGRDELARLSRAFDAMADEVAKTHTQLRSDIDQRARIQRALEESEASYRAIFDAAEDAIFVHEIDTGAVIDVNPKACASYDYGREELLAFLGTALARGEPPYRPEDAQRLAASIAGEPQYYERRGKNRDGSLRWDEVFVKRVPIGGRDRVLVLTREITARKLAEAALRASEEQYRSMFNASIDGLVLRSAAGEIVDVNPAMSRIFGYDEAGVPALPTHKLLDPAAHAQLHDAIASGSPWHGEIEDVRRDGAPLELEVHAIPMQYQGEPHVLTIVRDITEKKHAATELARQREALYQREKLAALGSLLAGVAHELNNPLSVVVARSVLLEEQGVPATRIAAERIRTAAERCARIVRTFLAMARQQTPEPGPVAINEVVAAALDITGYAVRTSSIEIETELAEDIPCILADADQLHQVMLNLVINAQQALQERPLPRRIRIVTRFEAERGIRIEVSDNGPGIAEAVRARIFEPYFTTKPVGVGTGVGLAVSAGIIEAHGGTLGVECPVGGGTVFTIVLPFRPAQAHGGGQGAAPAEAAGERRILVVDDEAEVREVLSEILAFAEHRVETAASGREALLRMQSRHYDIVVTDVRMPDMDGLALYGEIKRRWPERAARVVFVTGDTLSPTLRELADAGDCRVIEKPFVPGEVRRVVSEAAARSEPEALRRQR